MPTARISAPPSFDATKAPTLEALKAPMLATERAIDMALKKNFGQADCEHLAACLDDLQSLLVEEGSELPIALPDDSGLVGRVLIMIDVALCCWRNDDSAIPPRADEVMNHIARMKLNPQHCKTVLDFTRMFLGKYDRLLSVESAMLRV